MVALAVLFAASGAAHARGAAPAYLTPELLPAWNGAERGFAAPMTALLKRVRIIYVAGIISDSYIRCSEKHGTGHLGCSYFDESVADFRARGFDVYRSKIESEAETAVNAKVVAREIAASPTPVILITHSKGCLDTLEALLANPGLWSKVIGWIPVQGPFFGSPVARWVAQSPALLRTTEAVARKMGGTIGSLTSLLPAVRERYMADHRLQIAALTAKIRVVSVAGWKPKVGVTGLDTVLFPLRNAMLTKEGVESDGLVPRASSALPGSLVLDVPGLDHAMPAYHVPSNEKFDRARFYRALLGILASEAR